MLHEFLQANRDELIARCAAKAAKRNTAPLAPNQYGVPRLIDQLITVFRLEQTPEALARHKAAGHGRPSLSLVPSDIGGVAAKHGIELHQQGLTVDQVVHDYGDLCQALTEIAMEKDQPISVEEFHTFNRCSDDAIADAVTGFTKARLELAIDKDVDASEIRVGPLGTQMLILLEATLHSFAAMTAGQVGIQGATAMVLQDNLLELRDLVGGALGKEPEIRMPRPGGGPTRVR